MCSVILALPTAVATTLENLSNLKWNIIDPNSNLPHARRGQKNGQARLIRAGERGHQEFENAETIIDGA
jgi:hypothetical protein